MKKMMLPFLMLLTLLFVSCEKDEEMQIIPSCLDLAAEINDEMERSGVSRTRIEWTDNVLRGSFELPQIDACFLKFKDHTFNLDQLISFEVSGSEITFFFP